VTISVYIYQCECFAARHSNNEQCIIHVHVEMYNAEIYGCFKTETLGETLTLLFWLFEWSTGFQKNIFIILGCTLLVS